MHRITAVVLGALCAAGVFAGCDEAPDCTETVNHYYEVGCYITVGSSPLSLEDARTNCTNMQALFESCGCGAVHDNWRTCLADTSAETCAEGCAEAFEFYNACYTERHCSGAPP